MSEKLKASHIAIRVLLLDINECLASNKYGSALLKLQTACFIVERETELCRCIDIAKNQLKMFLNIETQKPDHVYHLNKAINLVSSTKDKS